MARLSNLLILGIALIIMTNLGSIQEAWHISLLFGAGMGSVLVLRWLWERINLYSEVAAIIASIVIGLVIQFVLKMEAEWLRLLLMSTLSTIVVLAVTWLTPVTDAGTLNAFYRRVRPAGLWRKSASATGDDPRRPLRAFYQGAYLVVTCAATLFLLLIGMIKLLLPAPGSTVAFAWVYIVAGAASAALWWRRLFSVGSERTTSPTE